MMRRMKSKGMKKGGMMSKGYRKGGMVKSKGYRKGGAVKKKPAMSLAQIRAAAKKKGYKLVKA